MTVQRFTSPDALADLADLPFVSEAEWRLTQPDLHLVAFDRRQRPGAHASVWWRHDARDPEHPGDRTGVLGHFDAHGDALASGVLAAAMDALRENGCTRVVGPMDGSPWHAYRVVSPEALDGEAKAGEASGGERTPHPPFAMEPNPPPGTERWLRAAGFETVAAYHSALVAPLPDRAEALRERTEAARASGVSLRPFDPSRAEDELAALYRISLAAFARNAFYVPISRDAFFATYRPLVARVDPRLIVVAEREGEVVGICFGVPDLAQAARGKAVDTVLVKTVAVAPEAAGAGLGGLLVMAVEERARAAGFSRSIHALMHDGNRSVRISRSGASRVIRRYALLGRAL